MANLDNRGTPRDPRGSNNSLYFIVGALVIAVLIIGWFMYGGDDVVDDAADVNVTTEEPVTPAADADVDVDVDAVDVEPVDPTESPIDPGEAVPVVEPTTPAAEPTTPAAEPTTPAAEPATPSTTDPVTPPAGGTTTTP